jgi:hypothetical protein
MFVKNHIGSGAKHLRITDWSPQHLEAREKIDFFGKKTVWCMRLTAANVVPIFLLWLNNLNER